MNRHSPLFRVAFVSLLLALSLPSLVYVAAHVRQRQLQSTANPRWARFNDVNGSRTDDKPTPQVRTAVDTKPKSADVRTADSHRIPVRPIGQSTGLTGSATGNLRNEAPPAVVAATVPVEIQSGRPRSSQNTARLPQSSPEVLSPQQTADLRPAPDKTDARVPDPDDMAISETVVPPTARRVSPKPKIEFRALEETSPASDTAASRMEARLVGMQRRLDQLAQVQVDKQVSDLDRALNLLQQAQQAQQNQPSQQPQPGPRPFDVPATAAPSVGPAPSSSSAGRAGTGTGRSSGTVSNGGSGREPSIKIIQGDLGDHDERFSIQVQEANLTEVLEMLGQLAGVNILSSRDVVGRVSLNLQDVTVDRALDAILKSQGFVHERDGDIIYVRTANEDTTLKQANRKLITKVYQPLYISANELSKLISPILTKGDSRFSVTSPAQVGIAQTPTAAGGDGLSQRDALLVQDYPDVLAEVDRIIIEMDVPPLQVIIEAKILNVRLSDSMEFGVNFAMLNGAKNNLVSTGDSGILAGTTPAFPATSLAPPVGDFLAHTAGLKYGFIQGDVTGFIKALENIADTSLVAAPQLRVLNKQKAEMIIGGRVGYSTNVVTNNTVTQNVQFLDFGTKLIFRPFISPDGLVRLEVHPERSTATINKTTLLPDQSVTEVTTNVMVRDGTTVVIGGLISEETTESIDRVPLLGALPLVGAAFRNKSEQTVRNEMIVLITPRIVTEPEAAIEGEKLQFETQERAADFRNNLSPVNRTSLTRAHFERAADYFEQGNLLKAKQQIDAALRQNKADLECQKLRLKIDHALRDQQAKAWRWPGSGNRAVQR